MNKLRTSDEALRKIDGMLKFMKDNDLVTKGYLCGIVNGLRLARSYITGEEEIFERNEAQRMTRKDVDLFLESLFNNEDAVH